MYSNLCLEDDIQTNSDSSGTKVNFGFKHMKALINKLFGYPNWNDAKTNRNTTAQSSHLHVSNINQLQLLQAYTI